MTMTLENFAAKAVGIPVPFEELGRSYGGWDCWGLVVMAYREVLGVELHDYSRDYESVGDVRLLRRLFEDRRRAEAWIQVDDPRPMDLACIFRRGLPIHVGLLLPRRRLLHVEKGVDTVHQHESAFRIEGYYRPPGAP